MKPSPTAARRLRFCSNCTAELPRKRRVCPECHVLHIRRESMAPTVDRGFGTIRSAFRRSAGQRAKLSPSD